MVNGGGTLNPTYLWELHTWSAHQSPPTRRDKKKKWNSHFILAGSTHLYSTSHCTARFLHWAVSKLLAISPSFKKRTMGSQSDPRICDGSTKTTSTTNLARASFGGKGLGLGMRGSSNEITERSATGIGIGILALRG